MTEFQNKLPQSDLSLQSPAYPADDKRSVATRIDAVADALIAGIDPNHVPTDSYRRLLHKAMMVAADAQRELARTESELKVLRKLTITDELTKVLNRRGFDRALDKAVGRARRSCTHGLLLFIDLDGFKLINDQYGHVAGDMVLATVATLLRLNVREVDDVARVGGDEFAIILNDTDPMLGHQKARQLDTMVNNLVVPWEEYGIKVRASMGLSTFGPTDDPASVLQKADKTMYDRKHGTAPPVDVEAVRVKALPGYTGVRS